MATGASNNRQPGRRLGGIDCRGTVGPMEQPGQPSASPRPATPILYLNMGGEMLYVLQQRLHTQSIAPDKTIQVMSDVIYALLNPKQLDVVFEAGPLLGIAQLRPILERVILSSIMKLDGNSMGKLFDLMIMMVKYQLDTATGPREILLSTLNHLDAIRDMALDRALVEHVDRTYRLLIETYGKMTHKDLWLIRDECLREIEYHNVRVSILLRLGMQNEDASFNRMIQRYDEQYKERKDVLDNLQVLEYADDDGVLGSLAIYGDRVTSLGKNVYSPTYGRVQSSKSSQSLNKIVAISNKSMRQELDTLATQLGKEEASTCRPFSLQLFANDNDRSMDCTPDYTNFNSNAAVEDAEGNVIDRPVNEYKNNLIDNINSEFSDNDPPRTEPMDLMNLLDVG